MKKVLTVALSAAIVMILIIAVMATTDTNNQNNTVTETIVPCTERSTPDYRPNEGVDCESDNRCKLVEQVTCAQCDATVWLCFDADDDLSELFNVEE